MQQDLAEQLELEGLSKEIKFGTFDGRTPELNVHVVNVQVTPINGSRKFEIKKAYALPKFEIRTPSAGLGYYSLWNTVVNIAVLRSYRST